MDISYLPPANMTMAHVDEEIARRKHELRDLYSYRNTLTPIFRLPTETLQAAFIHLARECYDEDDGASRSTLPDWVNVTYVCGYWRTVALESSTLWAHLFILSPRWTEELLARSEQASLRVNVDLRHDTRSRASHFLEHVMEHAERIQELCLLVDRPNFHVVVSSLSLRAPRLTSLKIFARGYYPDLPSVPFDGDAPMLRTLNLICSPISWHSLNVTGLTTLSLSNVPGRFQQNIEDFLATLESIRNLIHLNLYDALPSAAGFLSSAAFETFQKIDLPHLSRLRIDALISTVIALLHCLDVPLKTVVRLHCDSEPGLSLDDYAPLSSLLAQKFDTSEAQALPSSTVSSLNIRFGWQRVQLIFGKSEHVCTTTACQTHEMWDRNAPLKIDIHFVDPAYCDQSNSLISDICYSIPPTDISNLFVLGPPLSSAFWRKTLEHLQDIRHLKLESGCMPDLAPLLSVDHAQNQGGPLEKLELCDIEFTHPRSATGNMLSFMDVQSLYDALSGRKESQGLLILNHCSVPEDHIRVLDMVGRWEDGCFRVIKECIELSRPVQSAPVAPEGLEHPEESEDSEDSVPDSGSEDPLEESGEPGSEDGCNVNVWL